MDGVSAAASILGLLDAAIGIVDRLNDAYTRQKEQSSFLARYHGELKDTKSVIQVVDDETSLQTAAIASKLVKLEELSQKLIGLLQRLEPGDKSTARQFLHQLSRGSKDEKDITSIIDQIGAAKTTLLLYIQVAGVGLTVDAQRELAANTAIVHQVDHVVREKLGTQQGLKMVELIQNRPVREDGTVPLSPDDLKALGVSVPENQTTRIIVANLTQLQALQINGPVGDDEWKHIKHLEIKDNVAGASSSQVNYPVSGPVFASLLLDHSIKYILLFVLICLPFYHFFVKN